MHYAGFWKRFVAYGYDATFLSLVALGVWYVLAPAGWQAFVRLHDAAQSGILDEVAGKQAMHWVDQATYLMIILSVPYTILFTAGSWQGTPGKRWCGLKVVTADGARLTLKQSIYRHAASGLSIMPVGLGFLLIGCTKEKLALHDWIARTRVVYRNT